MPCLSSHTLLSSDCPFQFLEYEHVASVCCVVVACGGRVPVYVFKCVRWVTGNLGISVWRPVYKALDTLQGAGELRVLRL